MKQFGKSFFLIFLALLISTKSQADEANNDLIIINKNNVVHKFVPHDSRTDHFTRSVFQNWDNETFEVFEKVQDKEGIAIDIGAWIGTTAIWLSNNFHHVIAVDADKESLECLKKNLAASDCFNVQVCPQAIMDKGKKIVFGPRGNVLNESISCTKKKSNNDKDYEVEPITFKQLVHEYIYENEALAGRDIKFIKCHIEGGEEYILEDILHFAYTNHCKVYISFHLGWWQEKNIDDLKYLFKYFKSNCPEADVAEYIKKNPFASILFEPLDCGVLLKKNITAVVIAYNQLTYIKDMVEQLEKYTNDIVVIDNNSNYQPLLDYYKNDYKYTLLKKKVNYGAAVHTQKFVQQLAGDLYILTDPDLKFNQKLPQNFIQDFVDISNHFQAGKVGFALLIDADDIRTDVKCFHKTIQEWEQQFWVNKLNYPKNPKLELYQAEVDTTFCLINKRFDQPHVRVAGDYTCKHIPWHKKFEKQLKEGEYDCFQKGNNSSNWFGTCE